MAPLLQPKRIAALIAAYGVALQAILPFLTLPAFAVGADTTIICTSASGGPSLPATGHGAACPSGVFCSMPGCDSAAPPSAPEHVHERLAVAQVVVAAPSPADRVVHSLRRNQSPRAPPLA